MTGLIYSLLADALQDTHFESEAWEIVLGDEDWRARLDALEIRTRFSGSVFYYVVPGDDRQPD